MQEQETYTANVDRMQWTAMQARIAELEAQNSVLSDALAGEADRYAQLQAHVKTLQAEIEELHLQLHEARNKVQPAILRVQLLQRQLDALRAAKVGGE